MNPGLLAGIACALFCVGRVGDGLGFSGWWLAGGDICLAARRITMAARLRRMNREWIWNAPTQKRTGETQISRSD